MVAFPDATPVTTPDDGLTDATEALLLLQVPPVLPLVAKVVDKPAQTVDAPLTVPGLGRAFTVIFTETEEVAHADVTA